MSIWRKHKGNILDYVPLRNPKIDWQEKSMVEEPAGGTHVQLTIIHRGMLDRLVQKFFKRPASSTIDLDRFGSFVWKQIDGEKSVNEIADELWQEFGEDAEPLYDRLVKFLRLLRNNDLVSLYKSTE